MTRREEWTLKMNYSLLGTMMMVINERLQQDVEDEGTAIHLVDV